MNADPAAPAFDWPRLSSLLDEMLDRPPAERLAWLAGREGIDADLAARLRAMLTSTQATELPPLPAYGEVALGRLSPPEPTAISQQAIGPYRLLRELGHGGMGSVWLAERADGLFARRVALKLPHVSLPRRQLAERFARERDILAALEHPHIARLYDAGIADDGRPYLAMELIDGDSLVAWCDARRLGLRQRIELFMQVLDAVAHAHDQLVVHRDLKPSNILVSGDGQARLLDFGIAKLLTDGEARETELTRLGGRALSPQYASPEQILGRPIGVASDVYSLGVVLFELLTGSLPYRLRRGPGTGLEEAIVETEALRPSQALPSANRPAARALARRLRGDLDTIVLKALKKSPAQRYPNVRALADDLRRHLDGRPVLARPDSRGYRAWRFVRRNALPMAAATAVTVSLLAGAGLALWQARVARDEARTARAVQTFLLDLFKLNSSSQPDPQKARQTSARELLDIGYRKLDGALDEAPRAKLEILATLGRLYGELGLNKPSAELAERRIAIAREVDGADSLELADADLDYALAVSADLQGRAKARLDEAEAILARHPGADAALRSRLWARIADYWEERDGVRSAAAIEHALGIMRRLPPSRTSVEALYSAAGIYLGLSDLERVRSDAREAIAQAEGPVRDAGDLLPNLFNYLGQADQALGRLAEAHDALRQSWQRSLAINGEAHADTLTNLAEFAHFEVATGHAPSEGLGLMQRAAAGVRRQPGSEDLSTRWIVRRRLAGVLARSGRIDEALAELGELRQAMAPLGASPRVAVLMISEAEIRVRRGETGEAMELADQAQSMLDGTRSLDPIYEFLLRRVRAQALIAAGRGAEALQVSAADLPDPGPPNGVASTRLNRRVAAAEASLAGGDARQAYAIAGTSLAAIEASPERPYLAGFEFSLRFAAGRSLRVLGRPDDAQKELRLALNLAERLFDTASSLDLAGVRIELGGLLAERGRTAEAADLASRAARLVAVHGRVAAPLLNSLRELQRRAARPA